MKFSTALCLAAAGVAAAQTPPGFQPYTNNSLLVDFPYGGGTSLHPVGLLLNQSVVAQPPSHVSTFAPLPDTYIVAFIDSTTTLYDGSSTQALQWLQTDVTQLPGNNVVGPTGPVTVYSFKYNESEAPAVYVAPLATKAPSVHTFVILLFKQPEGFAPNDYLSKHLAPKPYSRIPFDITKAGLGEPLFATYFTLAQNTTSTTNDDDDDDISIFAHTPGAADFCYLWTQDVFNDTSSLPYFAYNVKGSSTSPSPAEVSAACESAATALPTGSGRKYYNAPGWGGGRWSKRSGGAVLPA